ncbi:hypothetical protein [Hymenobacter crusticola]|uniref:Uncharacterized protein n=1 Tax=Hymenobacter crusticola TaxID=1770526 RepID=A0A243W6G8_9BACT|nr:hypothetical protein [Hymenobacter crusticola]OUJ69921.1 hypothetical protein BXP70_25610 [Hymenobacter crusticola]
MAEGIEGLLFGALGALGGAGIQYYFQRRTASRQERKEIIETHLLQLQNSVESLYYRLNNLRFWSGKEMMSDDYYTHTWLYIVGRVLAYEHQLVIKGIYAKLDYNDSLKRELKLRMHNINWNLDDGEFLHYHRVQLAEMTMDKDRIITYTEFSDRVSSPAYSSAVAPALKYLQHAPKSAFEKIRTESEALVNALQKCTKVPSALSLTEKS